MRHAARREEGFTYLMILFAVAVMGVAMAATGTFWHQVQQRAKERELLAIGGDFRRAIAQYVRTTPSGPQQYPRRLEDLVRDPRVPGIARHLRRIPIDPMTGKPEWGLVETPDGAIKGVHSLSSRRPIKSAGFSGPDRAFEGKREYSEWKFVHESRTNARRAAAPDARPPRQEPLTGAPPPPR